MRNHPHIADAFVQEMEKISLGNIGGASAATLGAVGSLLGGGAGYIKAKAEGEDTKGALLGAGKGAVVGGVGGAAGGAGLAALSSGAGKSIGNFGRRQVHAVSDYVPKSQQGNRQGYLESIGVGLGAKPRAGLEAAEKHLKDVESGGGKGWIPMPHVVRHNLAKWDKFNAEQALKSHNELMRAGATSIPGMAKAVWSPAKRGDLMRGVGRDLAFGGGALGTGMMALGAHDLYKGIKGDVQPGQENMGRGERLGESIGNAAGWLVPTPIPLAGQVVGGAVLSKAFGGAGSLVDRIAGNKSPSVHRPPITDPTDPVASTAQQLGGVQSTMSQSASGKPYGGGMEQ